VWDTSAASKGLCVIVFAAQAKDFPPINQVGQIIYISQLSISEFKNELQGKATAQTKMLVYNSAPPFVPKGLRSHLPVVTQVPEALLSSLSKKLDECYQYSMNDTHYLSMFETLKIGSYVDIVCKVLNVDINQKTFQVWDGTSTKLVHPE
jgi:hypothetical protein